MKNFVLFIAFAIGLFGFSEAQFLNDPFPKIKSTWNTPQVPLGKNQDSTWYSIANYNWMRSGSNIYSRNTGNVGIGTSSPSSKLHVVGQFQLVDGTQAKDYVLKTDATGHARWNTTSAISRTRAQISNLILGDSLAPNSTYFMSDRNIYLYAPNSSSVSSSALYKASNVDWQNVSGKFIGVWNGTTTMEHTPSTGEFVTGELVTGGTSGAIGEIVVSFLNNAGSFYCTNVISTNGIAFQVGEVITGSANSYTATVSTVYTNSILGTIAINKIVSWSNVHYINTTGVATIKHPKYDTANWTALATTDVSYQVVYDEILYDYSGDIITGRRDKLGNVVIDKSAYPNSVTKFQWGRTSVFNNTISSFEFDGWNAIVGQNLMSIQDSHTYIGDNANASFANFTGRSTCIFLGQASDVRALYVWHSNIQVTGGRCVHADLYNFADVSVIDPNANGGDTEYRACNLIIKGTSNISYCKIDGGSGKILKTFDNESFTNKTYSKQVGSNFEKNLTIANTDTAITLDNNIYGVYNVTTTGGVASIDTVKNMPPHVIRINPVSNNITFVHGSGQLLKTAANETISASQGWIEFQLINGRLQEKNSSINFGTGSGSVSSIATTSPIAGGIIVGSGTISCPTCVTSSSPGSGVAHFAGSTQTVTSSSVVNSDIANSTIDVTSKITGLVPLVNGGTNANLSATGGTSQYLKQLSSGAAVTVGTIPAGDIASGEALTKVDDTNVTLTLGGTPTTSLLKATSLTLGWTGTLADGRISSASTWNAKESALTFSTGLTRSTNTITNNLSTGVSGGQSVIGGTASGNNLTFSSTSNATKGKLLFGTSAYDEVNNRLGIGQTSPQFPIETDGAGSATTKYIALWLRNTTSNSSPQIQFTSGNSTNWTVGQEQNGADGTSFGFYYGNTDNTVAPNQVFTINQAGIATVAGAGKIIGSSTGKFYFDGANLGVGGSPTARIHATVPDVATIPMQVNVTTTTGNRFLGLLLKGVTSATSPAINFSCGPNGSSADWTIGAGASGGSQGTNFVFCYSNSDVSLAESTKPLDIHQNGTVTIGTGTTNQRLVIGSTSMFYFNNGFLGINQSSPTARIHPGAGTSTAGTAPLKLTAGTNMTTPENGAVEFDGTSLFFTASSTRMTLAQLTSNQTFSQPLNVFTNEVNIGSLKATLKAGAAGAGNAPLYFTSGTNLTTPAAGAVEFDGTNYFGSLAGTRYTFAKTLSSTATLDFPNTVASSSSDLTMTVTGAADGDLVIVTPPNGSVVANSFYTAWVSSANTVTVRFSDLDILNAANPASGTFRASVLKY